MNNTREIAAEYRISHWAQVMQERTASGLNIKEFCKQIGICQNTYFYWQRKVRAALCEKLLPAAKNETSLVPKGWAICEAAEPKISERVLPIEIGGYRVLADADVDADLLAKVCRVLKSLC